MRLRYQLTLKDAVSLPTTAGRGEGALGFIPGAMILGAVASRGYNEAHRQGLAWDLFHSGVVSFGDATLLDPRTGAPAIRTPLSLHHLKRSNYEESVESKFMNFAKLSLSDRASREEGAQPEQTRGFITPSGWLDKAAIGYALKTSIEVDTQRASEGMLFGHQYLEAGLRLGFTVLIDDNSEDKEALKEFVSNLLIGDLRFGRSRSAEFGGASVSPITDPPQEWLDAEPDADVGSAGARLQHPTDSRRSVIHYLLLSETCLIDEQTGEPTNNVSPSHLGFDPARFKYEPDYSFVRTTRWTPFNSYRGRPDFERVALTAGSVLTFSALDEDWDQIDFTVHLASIEQGIGDYVAEGMGRIKAAHPFLIRESSITSRRRAYPRFKSKEMSQLPPSPNDQIGKWLAERRERELYEERALSIALALLDRASPLNLRVLIPNQRSSGRLPNQTQWRGVEWEARRALFKVGGSKFLRENLLRAPKRAKAEEGKRGDLIEPAGLLIRGKSKDVWRLEGDETYESGAPIKSKPGLAVVALLTPSTYDPYEEEHIQILVNATQRRLQAWGKANDPAKVRELIYDFLMPMVLTHVARAIAARLQQKEKGEEV